MTHHPGLKQLVGRDISSVEFVRGYIQLRFDGACLSTFTLPTVRLLSGTTLLASSTGYADALVSLVGKAVEDAQQGEAGFHLLIAGGVVVSVSTSDADRRVAEAATLTTDGATIWSW